MITYKQFTPNENDLALARFSIQQLSHFSKEDNTSTDGVVSIDSEETIKLPAGVMNLLMDILSAIAAGQSVTIIPQSQELTTFQAADILNVSRPFLIKLLESGKIPYRKVGKHRRIRLEDVMAYKQVADQERAAILDELVADAQEQDMGYE
ncbi:MAG: hypothetical protein Kow00117_18650 [Phototrophicales bacterium]